jgi:hypothetical protein
MGSVYFSAPLELLSFLNENCDISYFVETGTYLGRTATAASRIFERVYTIESSQYYFEKAARKISQRPNIKHIYGDSQIKLPEIVSLLDKPTLFWLDDHYMYEQNSYGENKPCPIMEEIALLNRLKIKHWILIDDARLFGSPGSAPLSDIDKWPTLQAVINLLNSSDCPRYVVVEHDIIIAVPMEEKMLIAKYCRLTYENSYKIKNSLWAVLKNFLLIIKRLF